MGKLDGKVAIVTGAARGLGRAYAKRLAGLGAKVGVFDINLRSYQEFEAERRGMPEGGVVGEIEAAGGVALGRQVDAADPEAIKAAVAKVVEAWGRVDVLVANAGGGAAGAAGDTRASTLDPALLEWAATNNLFSTVYSVAAVAPIMKAQGSGKIITVGSLAGLGHSADGSLAHYGATKAAVVHYTRYLAQDLGPFGVTANCLTPGIMATGRIAEALIASEEQARRVCETIALRRVGAVEDCARVVEFLATDLSDYVTGAVIPCDGGMRAG
jgi:3-oxoacyl-[acyl-carrier protein] reductase